MTVRVTPVRSNSLESKELVSKSLSLTSPDRVDRFRIRLQLLELLAPILLEFYYCEGPVFVLNAVVQLVQAQLDLAALYDIAHLPAAKAQYGDVMFAVFELDHDLRALELSIEAYKDLLSHDLPHASFAPTRCYIEARLAYSLICRHKFLEEEEDLQTAIEVLSRARHSANGKPPNVNYGWISLVDGLKLEHMFKIGLPLTTITIPNLQHALISLKDSCNATMPKSLYLRSLVVESALCTCIHRGTEGRNEPTTIQYLDSVINSMKMVLGSFSGGGEVLHHQILTQLGISYANMRIRTEDQTDVVTYARGAVSYISKACSLTNLMARNIFERLSSLQRQSVAAVIYSTVSQDLDILEKAVDDMRTVVLTTPPGFKSYRWHITATINLGFALVVYFEQTGRVAALDEMLSVFQSVTSLELTCETNVALNFADALLLRANTVKSHLAKPMIKDAIQVCQARRSFLSKTGVNRNFVLPEQVSLEIHLITASRMQINVGERPLMDPDELLRLAQEHAKSANRQDYVRRVLLTLAQTDVLMWKASLSADKAPLIAAGLFIVDQHLSYPELGGSNFTAELLGARADLVMMQSRLENVDRKDYLHQAWHLYERATHDTSGRPGERFRICLRWASRASDERNPQVALRAYSRAIDILPQVIFLGEEVAGRIEALRQVGGLAASSVATALVVRDTALAIDFLERSRGILWLQSFQPRAVELDTIPTNLRREYIRVGGELSNSDQLTWTTRRHKAEELKQVILEIRRLPDLKRFQLPPQQQDIQLALQSKGAYAVIIVPSGSHCDVIILGMGISTSDVRYLLIPVITTAWTRHRSYDLNSRCANARATHERENEYRGMHKALVVSETTADPLSTLLSELWVNLVHPIIQRMDIHKPSNPAERKRVYWCSIGALSSLPLHAAGIYQGSTQDHAGNYVISSYIPSLSALHHLLTETHTQIHHSPTRKMVLIAQPTSTGLPLLANVQTEIEEIKAIVSADWKTATYDNICTPVTSAVADIGSANMLHLACHGHQDQIDPLNSGFDLSDGRLTLGQLMRLNLPDAQLAYLSACDSAGTDESRPDEGLNLVGAMIFVGFRSVIGTMWTMNDLDGPFMAKRVYSRIFKDGKLDLDAVPVAVDDAVRELRESGVPASRWATYVHFGV